MTTDDRSISERLAEDIQAYLTMDGIYLDSSVTSSLAECLLMDEDWVIRMVE